MKGAIMNAEHIFIGWRFGLRWVLLTVAGWIIGVPLGFVFVAVAGWIIGVPEGSDSIILKLGLDNAAAFICLVAVVGLMQWLALRRVVQRAGFWVPANLTGFIVSSSIHAAACYFWKIPDNLDYLPGILAWTLSFILGGTLTGLLQQRILRHHVCRSGWWVPASAAGWGLGVIGLGTFHLVVPMMREGPVVLLLIRNLIAPTILGGGLLGIVTGATLIWLLRQPRRQTAGATIS
jgi:hypothetical protein